MNDLFKEARRLAAQLQAHLSLVKELEADSVKRYIPKAQGLVNEIERLLKKAEKDVEND